MKLIGKVLNLKHEIDRFEKKSKCEKSGQKVADAICVEHFISPIARQAQL